MASMKVSLYRFVEYIYGGQARMFTDGVQSSNGVIRNSGNYRYGNYVGNAPHLVR